MSRFMRGLFQTARTISTIDPTAPAALTGGPSPGPGWNVRSMLQMFVRTVVRMRVIVSYSLLFISISLNIFCPHFDFLLDFIFPCATRTFFSFYLPPLPSCDTPTNASVCNGLCGVRVVLICYLTG